LDRDYRVAKKKLAAILRDRERSKAAGENWLDARFCDLCNEFLDDIQARRGDDTFSGYRYRLLRALRTIGTTVRVGEVRRLHLTKIEQALTGNVSPTTIRDTIAAVQTVFHWAVRNDVIDNNPVARHPKPRGRSRNRTITPEEFQMLLRAMPENPAFRRVLLALRMTGCRPKEIRTLQWPMVDLEQGLWILHVHKTITTQRSPRPRMVPLPDPLWAMCRWLDRRLKSETEYVFLNMHGLPYTKDRLVQNMCRARRRAGIAAKSGEQIVLYSNRHTYGTEAAGKVTDIELAELMGHTTTQMTKRYVHLNASRLRDIRRRIEDGSA
jgi:integrase